MTTTNPHPQKWDWKSIAIGAITGATTIAIVTLKPKDPSFELISITLTSFNLTLSGLDAELIITVHLTNPNLVPVTFGSATMSIIYDGSVLGSAQVDAGAQPGRSCRLMKLPARLSGVELLAHHKSRFLKDVARREMEIGARVVVDGSAKVGFWWEHRFRVNVESRICVDPVFLDVIEQDNKSEMELFVTD